MKASPRYFHPKWRCSSQYYARLSLLHYLQGHIIFYLERHIKSFCALQQKYLEQLKVDTNVLSLLRVLKERKL